MRTPPFPIWPLVASARKSDALTKEAATLLSEDAPRWFGPKERDGLRTSDAGRCTRELWGEIHGLFDVPDNLETMVNRLDIGTVMGAWYACLFSAALSELTPYTCTREEQITYDGIPGHADVVVYHDDRPLWVIDFKSNYSRSSGQASAKPYQCLQVARYALGAGAAVFSIFTIAPALTSPMYTQNDFATPEFSGLVAMETQRLLPALGEAMPAANPPESWRCKYCRLSMCERNAQHALWAEVAG